MMRDCGNAEIRDQLPLFAAGRLDPASRAQVEAHLAACADCRAELALLESVQRAYPAPDIDVARIAAAMPRANRRARRIAFHQQPLWRVAATLTLFIAGTATVLIVRRGGSDAAATPQDSLAVNVAVAPPESAVTVRPTQGSTAAGSKALVALGTDLSALSDEELETLLGSLDGLDSRPQADPTTIAKPIVQEQANGPGRSNQ